MCGMDRYRVLPRPILDRNRADLTFHMATTTIETVDIEYKVAIIQYYIDSQSLKRLEKQKVIVRWPRKLHISY